MGASKPDFFYITYVSLLWAASTVSEFGLKFDATLIQSERVTEVADMPHPRDGLGKGLASKDSNGGDRVPEDRSADGDVIEIELASTNQAPTKWTLTFSWQRDPLN